MRPQIIYEDNNIIICNKPAGVASQSERSFEVDLMSGLKTALTAVGKKSDLYIINRLDKPVAGLVLFARSKAIAAKLSALSGEHSIEKHYYAVVLGEITMSGEYVDYLKKDTKENVSRVVPENTPEAKKAMLFYEPLEQKNIAGRVYTLVKIRLLTGRHHQIRVQFSHHEHALYGDLKYNKDFAGKRGVTPALFAGSLSFNNPAGADRITVEVKPVGEIWNFEYFKQS